MSKESKLNKSDGLATYVKKDVQCNIKCEDIEIMKVLYTELNINKCTKLSISTLFRSH